MKTTFVVLSFLLAFASPVLARDSDAKDGPAGASQDAGPCKQDAKKLCPGTHPGDGKFGPCMKEHMDDVSDACRDKLKEMRDKMKERMAEKADACKEEAAKACPGMHPGDGKFGPCMKEHKDELSQGCRRVIGRMMAKGEKGHGEDGDEEKGKGKDDDHDHDKGDKNDKAGDHDDGDDD